MNPKAPQFTNIPPENPYGSPEAILEVLFQVRSAFSELISSAGADPSKTRDTARYLDLSTNLVWPVTHFINAEDILTATGEVIGRFKLEIVCDACEAKGAAADLVLQARQGIDKFEELVSHCTGDRQSFSLLLKGLSDTEVTNHQESTRKMAFQCNSSLWGVQCQFSFKAIIFVPNTEEPDQVDAIRVFGMIDFRRLRPTPWPLYWMFAYSDDGSCNQGTSIPIEPQLAGSGANFLLKDFCSDPLPVLQPIEQAFGLRLDLVEGPIGNAGLLTCVAADRLVKLQSIYHTPKKNENLAAIFDLVTPQDHMIFDVFLHQDLPFSGPPKCNLFDRLTVPRGFDPESHSDRPLPLSSQVLDLGSGLAGSTTSQYPRYLEMMDYVFLQSGIDADEFRGYRLSIRYPQIPTAAVLRWKLAKKS